MFIYLLVTIFFSFVFVYLDWVKWCRLSLFCFYSFLFLDGDLLSFRWNWLDLIYEALYSERTHISTNFIVDYRISWCFYWKERRRTTKTKGRKKESKKKMIETTCRDCISSRWFGISGSQMDFPLLALSHSHIQHTHIVQPLNAGKTSLFLSNACVCVCVSLLLVHWMSIFCWNTAMNQLDGKRNM